jgi:hypothetical protein
MQLKLKQSRQSNTNNTKHKPSHHNTIKANTVMNRWKEESVKIRIVNNTSFSSICECKNVYTLGIIKLKLQTVLELKMRTQ